MLKVTKWWRKADWTERGSAITAGIGFAFVLASVLPVVLARACAQ